MAFGLHLMLDCYKCNDKKLADMQAVYEILNSVPDTLGLKKMSAPHVVKMEATDGWDKGGVSGTVLISTSHISVHTFAGYGYLTADIYSCDKFDTKKVVDAFQEAFEAKLIEKKSVVRGQHFQREVLPKIRAMAMQRQKPQ